jgi:hypothetical protein
LTRKQGKRPEIILEKPAKQGFGASITVDNRLYLAKPRPEMPPGIYFITCYGAYTCIHFERFFGGKKLGFVW